jgi:hypothetical protein
MRYLEGQYQCVWVSMLFHGAVIHIVDLGLSSLASCGRNFNGGVRRRNAESSVKVGGKYRVSGDAFLRCWHRWT